MFSNTKRPIALCILFLIFTGLLYSGCGQVREVSATGMFFDTVVDIRIVDPKGAKLLNECFALCEEMENTLSAHKESSELWKLNHRSADTVEVSDDLAACIREGLYYGEVSGGAFDITVFPLRELWNFESEDAHVPPDAAIKEALGHVDFSAVHIEGNEVRFDDPDTRIDLGGIAKGYIAKKLNQYLRDQGCTCALINLGGNVSAIGSRADGSPWVIGIQQPFAERGTVGETVGIQDESVISSGTYERYFEQNGERYHHILDPSTGYPAQTSLDQVTVIGGDEVRGDAFSTIGIVLGEENARRIVEEEGWDIELIFQYADDSK